MKIKKYIKAFFEGLNMEMNRMYNIVLDKTNSPNWKGYDTGEEFRHEIQELKELRQKRKEIFETLPEPILDKIWRKILRKEREI